MSLLRLTAGYWPVGTTQRGPAIELRRTPDPACPHCEGEGYVGMDPEGADQTECRCAPWKPILALPLPRLVNRCHRRIWLWKMARSRAGLWACGFCEADNGPDANRCGFCHYDRDQ